MFLSVAGALGSFAMLVGCATPVRPANDLPTVAVVVRLAGGGTLSPQQLTHIHHAVGDDIKNAGYDLAPNTDTADFLLVVRFTPDALEPNAGHVAITGIEPNPLNRRSAAARAGGTAESKEKQLKMLDMERWIQTKS